MNPLLAEKRPALFGKAAVHRSNREQSWSEHVRADSSGDISRAMRPRYVADSEPRFFDA